MSSEGHFCWEDCDEGQHGCICGHDCEPPRSIEEYHATRESGAGCPETNGGPHYFAHIEPSFNRRICIDCGEPENREED